MAIYTFHLPHEASPGDPVALEKAVIVRDGFSWGALIFQCLWCFWNRLWLVGFVFLSVSLGLSFGLPQIGMPEELIAGMGVFLVLLLAFEGNNLRRWTLEWRGFPLRGIVVANSVMEAERRAFSIWLEQKNDSPCLTDKPLQSQPALPTLRGQTEIVGLFPSPKKTC